MECLLIFFSILFLMFFVPAVRVSRISRRGRLRSVYQELAQRYRGKCLGGGVFGQPMVVFDYLSAKVVLVPVTAGGKSRAKLTQFSIAWTDPSLQCEVIGRPMPQRPFTRDALRDLVIGSADFDGRYVIRGTDPHDVAGLLNATVQWQINKLQHWNNNLGLRISVGQGLVQVQKRGVIRKLPELMQYVGLCLELYDQMMLTRTAGIAFDDALEAQPLLEVHCKICGESIEDELVFCRKCKTPHHLECWEYNGLCCVFGCGERNYETPRVADRLDVRRDQQNPE